MNTLTADTSDGKVNSITIDGPNSDDITMSPSSYVRSEQVGSKILDVAWVQLRYKHHVFFATFLAGSPVMIDVEKICYGHVFSDDFEQRLIPAGDGMNFDSSWVKKNRSDSY